MIDVEIILIAALIGSIIGSIFTLIVQYLTTRNKRKHIEKSISVFLVEIIKPINKKINIEIPIVQKAISEYNYKDISLGMHPSYNSSLLTAFPIDTLQPIYKDKLPHLIEIISILNNLEKRLPLIYFQDFIKDSQFHIANHQEKNSDLYPDERAHFLRCPAVIQLRDRTGSNLGHVSSIIKDLETNMNEIIK